MRWGSRLHTSEFLKIHKIPHKHLWGINGKKILNNYFLKNSKTQIDKTINNLNKK